ncbi:hypothetical protein [Haloarcula sp. Atlit-7R]|uniref:hypothetical protein n=1 Tax=Haloarcula sp. Atlit-7R TaxID=2282125 RepID=UPI000EF16DB8|nr:hypothetical protein [Haloarcula sp. Atlit-7R]RLM90030.1 hypothetical protein D3D01_18210 [Haloarcula sp. Atlit-7R]
MADEDYAHQALSALERIDVETLEQECRDAHEDAITAVDELAALLESDSGVEDQDNVDTPEEWADDEDDWDEKVSDAYEQAEIPRSKGTLTVKTIDDREYYYLQWRDRDAVRSQYIAPVRPA